MTDGTRWMVGLVLAALIAALARRAGSLTTGGAVAAAGVGTIAVAAGWSWGLVLVAYFVSAAALSRVRAAERSARVSELIEKEGPRDAVQVLANGGVFALAAIGYRAAPDPLWQTLGAAALSASAADSWATEVGTLASTPPRSILDWRPVPAGTSGGVTAQGLLAGVAGAAFVAACVWLVRWPTPAIAAAVFGGIAGSLVDSWLGATLQARRWCAACAAATERRVHRCGAVTTMAGGLRWLNNDGVNALSTIGGALLGAAGARYF